VTLSARIARAESRAPQPAPTVTVVRRFYTPCPVCRRHGGARVRHVRENDPAAPAGRVDGDVRAHARRRPARVRRTARQPRAWDYYEWREANPPADPHAPAVPRLGSVTHAEWADAWRTLKAHGHVMVVGPGRDEVTP
jgi:hypothetical protein